jgi:hypothetical protein
MTILNICFNTFFIFQNFHLMNRENLQILTQNENRFNIYGYKTKSIFENTQILFYDLFQAYYKTVTCKNLF